MPHPDEPIDAEFWSAAAACAVATIAFCFSPLGTEPTWWTPALHGVALGIYGTLLLRFRRPRLGKVPYLIVLPYGIVAAYFILVSSLLLAFLGPLILVCTVVGIVLMVGAPLSLVYSSGKPAIASCVAGFMVIPALLAARRLAPSLFSDVLGGDRLTTSVFSATLHLGAIVSIVLGTLDSVREFSRRALPYCDNCGYDLSGVVASKCPECGSRARRAALTRLQISDTPNA